MLLMPNAPMGAEPSPSGHEYGRENLYISLLLIGSFGSFGLCAVILAFDLVDFYYDF